MTPRRLSAGELEATVTPSPRPAGVGQDLWAELEAYVAAVPAQDWQGHPAGEPGVPQTYRMRGGRWQHVLVPSGDRAALLVVVLNLSDGVVHGHRLLEPGGADRMVG